MFLAERSGRIAGRIAAIHNRAHNDYHGDRTGFFGFFECEDEDSEAANKLLSAAEQWLLDRNLETIRGPVNPSMNSECGVLIYGFDSPPLALMPYNPPSYSALLENAGLEKIKDLFSYAVRQDRLSPGQQAHDRLSRSANLLARRYPGVSVRSLNMKNLKNDILRFLPVFEEARRNNWGYVPLTGAEVMEMIRDFRNIVDPEIVILAEVDGDPAGISMAMPNINIGLSKINGRLFPFGFLKFKKAMRNISQMRIFGIASLEKYRHLGITARLLNEIILRGSAKGYLTGEASWILEDNLNSNRMIQNLLAPKHSKTYRIYQKKIS